MTEPVRKSPVRAGLLIPFILFLFAVGISFWAYPQLPDHLETYSDVEWVTQKGVVIAIFPLFMLFIFFMFQLAFLWGRKYVDVRRLKSVLDALLIFILSSQLVVHTFMLVQPINSSGILDSPNFVINIVAIMFAIYLLIIGNYFPRIQRSRFQKEFAQYDKKKPREVFLTAIKMKALGLTFLSELYLLGLGSASDNPRLQKQIGSFASRILILGGVIAGVCAFLPGVYPIISMIVIIVVIAITSHIVVTRLKKKHQNI
ncbi:hypothetical protein J14TS2_38770 [Bacillus sp. J14TS2]|uniref:hypothetical protein n=1 Tax=Bacillus sp. J14TS2 TaxID=2807188 RepID=UPI001B11FC89|nr:hypothetical protein [Bacillus sp. J14TS2]GIN73402.1 hypothetical protein J14TS2_38770 [Bacillus sp. J14TS2]